MRAAVISALPETTDCNRRASHKVLIHRVPWRTGGARPAWRGTRNERITASSALTASLESDIWIPVWPRRCSTSGPSPACSRRWATRRGSASSRCSPTASCASAISRRRSRLSQPKVSRHLASLRAAGVVETGATGPGCTTASCASRTPTASGSSGGSSRPSPSASRAPQGPGAPRQGPRSGVLQVARLERSAHGAVQRPLPLHWQLGAQHHGRGAPELLGPRAVPRASAPAASRRARSIR